MLDTRYVPHEADGTTLSPSTAQALPTCVDNKVRRVVIIFIVPADGNTSHHLAIHCVVCPLLHHWGWYCDNAMQGGFVQSQGMHLTAQEEPAGAR